MSSPEEHPAAKKFKKGIVVSSHLLADGQPQHFCDLADLRLEFGEERSSYLCHSSFLGRSSQVFGEMFLSTPKEGWANGVASMFNGHQKKIFELVLAMIHGSCDVEAMLTGMSVEGSLSLDELEDLLRLAHKLDAPKLMDACEKYIALQKSDITADFCKTLRIMCMASTVELEALKYDFMDAALEAILTSDDPVKTLNEGRDLVGGWKAVNFEDFYRMFTAGMQGLKDFEKDYITYAPGAPRFYFMPDNADYRRKLLEM